MAIKQYEGYKHCESGDCTVYVRVPSENGSDSLIPIPHVVRHSPDGFQWGYGGSGPADCALSILTHFITNECPHLQQYIELLYQNFKWYFVAHQPAHLIITKEQIQNWLKEQIKD